MEDMNMQTPEQPQDGEELSLNLSGDTAKRKLKKWPIIIAAVIVVIAVAAALLWKPIMELFDPTGDKTLRDYEQPALAAMIDSVINHYDSLLTSENSQPHGTKIHIDFEIDQLALLVITKEYPELEILDYLNEISIDAAYENDGNKQRFTIAPVHEDADLPEGELILDTQAMAIYIAVQSLSDQYLKFDLSEFIDEDLDSMLAQLPESDALNKVLQGYLTDLLALTKEEMTSTQKVSAAEVEQSCTVCSAEINLKAFMELNIKTLDQIAELCGENTELSESILSAKKDLEEELESVSDSDEIIWTDYIDDQERIVGRNIKLSTGEEYLNYLCVKNGDNLGLIYTSGHVELSGTATCKNDELNGTFILSEDGVEYLKFEPDDVELKDLEKGEIKGKVKVTPSTELLEMMFGSEPALPTSFDVTFNITEDAGKVSVNYMDMVVVSCYITEYTPEEISLPQGAAIDGADTDAFYRWLESMDILKLMSELAKAGIDVSDFM